MSEGEKWVKKIGKKHRQLADVLRHALGDDLKQSGGFHGRVNFNRGANSLESSNSGIAFTTPIPRGTLPAGGVLGNSLSVYLDVDLKYVFNDDGLTLENTAINIHLESSKGYRNCWHFDTHIFDQGDNEPNECHPFFHAQNGGNELENNVSDYGEIVFTASPRMPHPPMDLVLATDFILSNFLADKWRQLKVNNQYNRLVEASQKEIWGPYFFSLSQHFIGQTSTNHTASSLYPQLILP